MAAPRRLASVDRRFKNRVLERTVPRVLRPLGRVGGAWPTSSSWGPSWTRPAAVAGASSRVR